MQRLLKNTQAEQCQTAAYSRNPSAERRPLGLRPHTVKVEGFRATCCA